MTFEHGQALWALIGLPVLWLLARLRRRPRAQRWPSLLVWSTVLAQHDPAPRKRAPDPLLLLESAALLLLVLAAAGPALQGERPEMRVVVVWDAGRHMEARRDGEEVRHVTAREIERIRASLPAHSWAEFEERRDLAVAAAGLRAQADLLIVASNRPGLEDAGDLVVGFAPTGTNTGIDAVAILGDDIFAGQDMWFVVQTDGPAREVEVQYGLARWDRATVPVGVGVTAPMNQSVHLTEPDNYYGDDSVGFSRLVPGIRSDVESPLMNAALFWAGVAARPVSENADLVIVTTGGSPAGETVLGRDCVAAGPELEGVILEDSAWRGARWMEGEGLLTWKGKALIRRLDDRTLWIGLPLDRDWDDHGTLAVFFDNVKRETIARLVDPVALVLGNEVATPVPGFVRTAGVDRPWDGTLPPAATPKPSVTPLTGGLALLAAAVLAFYLRAIVRASP